MSVVPSGNRPGQGHPSASVSVVARADVSSGPGSVGDGSLARDAVDDVGAGEEPSESSSGTGASRDRKRKGGEGQVQSSGTKRARGRPVQEPTEEEDEITEGTGVEKKALKPATEGDGDDDAPTFKVVTSNQRQRRWHAIERFVDTEHLDLTEEELTRLLVEPEDIPPPSHANAYYTVLLTLFDRLSHDIYAFRSVAKRTGTMRNVNRFLRATARAVFYVRHYDRLDQYVPPPSNQELLTFAVTARDRLQNAIGHSLTMLFGDDIMFCLDRLELELLRIAIGASRGSHGKPTTPRRTLILHGVNEKDPYMKHILDKRSELAWRLTGRNPVADLTLWLQRNPSIDETAAFGPHDPRAILRTDESGRRFREPTVPALPPANIFTEDVPGTDFPPSEWAVFLDDQAHLAIRDAGESRRNLLQRPTVLSLNRFLHRHTVVCLLLARAAAILSTYPSLERNYMFVRATQKLRDMLNLSWHKMGIGESAGKKIENVLIARGQRGQRYAASTWWSYSLTLSKATTNLRSEVMSAPSPGASSTLCGCFAKSVASFAAALSGPVFPLAGPMLVHWISLSEARDRSRDGGVLAGADGPRRMTVETLPRQPRLTWASQHTGAQPQPFHAPPADDNGELPGAAAIMDASQHELYQDYPAPQPYPHAYDINELLEDVLSVIENDIGQDHDGDHQQPVVPPHPHDNGELPGAAAMMDASQHELYQDYPAPQPYPHANDINELLEDVLSVIENDIGQDHDGDHQQPVVPPHPHDNGELPDAAAMMDSEEDPQQEGDES
ncbi:hypothetical protein NCLIV_028430 [Neospora caninum Liverpool]|uniref:Uncharacterized protein n=1 Tax=Neospora caninum (strain Liverpool) TaxID=572307 RepID=F0VH60_NEOCL|nr:hypothetical protein NCLIV_028430 [Neospora caninum Liverpool]CBZ53054.1 hypothetical protein NCLIV_028430 [Neospora caninum Liverpool]CEL67037.1 TPA: hypothetical protein BN1204_028430 [Neospora caninum Liverpool]|eukprot:XP_003883086.1 hypothetical protein NCLIV_028430 [Neospora caninum Liverpool]